jgi:glycosyltransferase involved in cell wall biosynthesis
MLSSDQNAEFRKQMTALGDFVPDDWEDIAALLNQIKQSEKLPIIPVCDNPLKTFARGTAVVTYSFGIDGVSIEISKYAHVLNDLLSPAGNVSIHLISGSFEPEAASILSPAWHRHQIEGIDGWDKWDDGRWFEGLFKKKMKSKSEESDLLTKEIFRQATTIANKLGDYFIDHQISLVVPVNIASNPGNMALTLGLVLVSEILGTYVLNINHDYYWEGGKSTSERDPEAPPGVRDHFFRNMRNRTFFSLLEGLYPWNGRRWLQVNINARQSRKLIDRYGIPKDRVFEISTYISDNCFEGHSRVEQIDSRLRMAHILSNGEAIMRPVPIADHLSGVAAWMRDQRPIIVGARPGLSVDPRSDDLIVLLQPTRIVRRKRIERNLGLIAALLRSSALRQEFEDNPNRQLILHVTGPTPKEHQKDLERVLRAYRKAVRALPQMLADRIFIAFSVGHETHDSFSINQFQPLNIEAIYRMADVVVFPSETEGRGLPIIEASACGIPIICSHYRHKEVFSDVIGEKLAEEYQIRHTIFPEGRFSKDFLSIVAALLMHPDDQQDLITHNRAAVRARYSQASFQNSFQQLLEQLCKLD